MKFRIDRDTLADAVAWTARSLPNRPSVPVLAGLLHRDRPATDSRCRDSTTRRPPAPRCPPRSADDGTALVSGRLLAEIVKSLPAEAGRRRRSTAPRCRSSAAAPASACRPCRSRSTRSCPTMPTATGTIKADDFATAVAQASAAAGARRDAAAAHRRPPRARGIHDLADGHRPVPRQPARPQLVPRGAPTSRPRPSCPPASWVRPRGRSPAGGDVTIAVSSGEAGDGLIGFEGTVGNGSAAPPPACSRATSRASASCSRPRPRRSPTSARQSFVDSVKRVAAGGRAQHARAPDVRRRTAAPRGRQRRRGPGVGVDRGHDQRRRHLDRVQPELPAGRARRSCPSRSCTCPSRSTPSPPPSPESQEVGADPDGAFRYLIMPVRLQN